MDTTAKIKAYLHRMNTEESWNLMRERFFSEWTEACDVMRRQSRWHSKEWKSGGSWNANEYFTAHAKRMVDERWWELRDGYAG